MFLKVFKYDFKAIFFKFIPVFAILPVIAIIVRILGLVNLEYNVFASLVWGFVNAFFIAGCGLFILYALVICIIRYTKALFRDQGYLTHTLPVNKHQLLLSQILADTLMALISLAIVLLCLMIAYYDPKIAEVIVHFINDFFDQVISVEDFFKLVGGTITLFIFSSLFSFLQSLLVIYTGIAIGHSFPKNKGILSVVFCIVINYVIGFVSSILSLTIGRIGSFAIISLTDGITALNVYMTVGLVESIIVCIGAYFLNIYLMKNKLNLE